MSLLSYSEISMKKNIIFTLHQFEIDCGIFSKKKKKIFSKDYSKKIKCLIYRTKTHFFQFNKSKSLIKTVKDFELTR